MGSAYVGVDVGGTKVLAVCIDAEGHLRASVQRPMPGRDAAPEDVERVLALAAADAADAAEAAGAGPVAGLGVSAAGLVDRDGEHYLFGAHLPWRDHPLRERMAALTGLPVVVDNDANCAAHAEVAVGAARGSQAALVITVGTGIGGALVWGGRVLRGAHGLAGEFGHMQVVPNGLACECGLRGCWEQYCSGRALERVSRVALGRHLDGREVSAMAAAGDRVARQAIASVGTWLGVGVAGLVSAFDPEVVVVGGGVGAVGDLLLEPARAALRESLQGTDHRPVPPVVPAALGPEAGAVGAALLARDGR